MSAPVLNTIKLSVTAISETTDRPTLMPTTDTSIVAEARRRLIAEQNKAQEKLAAEKRATELAESRVAEERIRLRAEEEMIGIMARRLAVEAEAKAAAEKREVAIKAEMERLRNRSQLEILEDKVAALTEALSGIDAAKLAEIRSRF
jgi:hypothetical protein